MIFFRTADVDLIDKFVMCLNGDYVITALNSQIIKKGDFDYDGYLLKSRRDCVNFWKGGLEDKIILDPKLNILGGDGEVRLVDIVDEDGYENIDFKKFKFVRLKKLKAEISNKSWKTETNVYYPVFRIKYWPA